MVIYEKKKNLKFFSQDIATFFIRLNDIGKPSPNAFKQQKTKLF